MSVNIYVGNLSYSMTEGQLRDLFGQHGEVVSVKIITDQYSGRSKGFGFIEMNDKNDAENAIRALDGSSIMDRALTVNFAKPRAEAPRRSNRY
jgi:RNA recognition motif-containing protein